MFLLLSGLGLYYAYQKYKTDSVVTFYKKRLARILPTYLPVVLVTCLLYWSLGEMSFTDVILNLTTLSFWLNSADKFDWYVAALLVLYLLTPGFMFFFNTKKKYITLTMVVFIGLLLSLLISSTSLSYLLIFTIRIPIFFFGILIGYFIDQNIKFTRVHLFLHIGMLLLGLLTLVVSLTYLSDYLWSYGLWWYPFILITLPLCIFASSFFHIISELGITKFRFLTFCGVHSLEIYLIHERVLKIATDINQSMNINMNNLILNLICFVITWVLALLLKRVVTKFTSRITHNKRLTKAAAS